MRQLPIQHSFKLQERGRDGEREKKLSVSTEEKTWEKLWYKIPWKIQQCYSSRIFNYSVKSVEGHILFSPPFSLRLIRCRSLFVLPVWKPSPFNVPKFTSCKANSFITLNHIFEAYLAVLFASVCKNFNDVKRKIFTLLPIFLFLSTFWWFSMYFILLWTVVNGCNSWGR